MPPKRTGIMSSPRVYVENAVSQSIFSFSKQRASLDSASKSESSSERRERYKSTSGSGSKRCIAWNSLDIHSSVDDGLIDSSGEWRKRNLLSDSKEWSRDRVEHPKTGRLSYEHLNQHSISLRNVSQGSVHLREYCQGTVRSPHRSSRESLSVNTRSPRIRTRSVSGDSFMSKPRSPPKLSMESASLPNDSDDTMNILNNSIVDGPNSAQHSPPRPEESGNGNSSNTGKMAKPKDGEQKRRNSIHTVPTSLLKRSRYSHKTLDLDGSRSHPSSPATIANIKRPRTPPHAITAERDSERRENQPSYASQGAYNSSQEHEAPLIKRLPGAEKIALQAAPCLQRKRRAQWRLRTKLFCFDANSSTAAKVFQYFMVVTILFSLVIVELETLDGPNWESSEPEFPNLFSGQEYAFLDFVFGIIFSVEFVVRLYVADVLWQDATDKEESSREIPFFKDILNWFDLLAILPFLIEIVLLGVYGTDKKSVAFLAILKTLRVFKIVRQFNGAAVLVEAVRRSFRPLALPMFFFTVFTLIFAALIYYFEPCLSKYSDECEFTDIFNSAYFIIVTMTTVGYGDQIPTRILARIVTLVVMIFGALFLSMPLAIIGNEFDNVWKEKENLEREMKEKENQEQKQALIGDDGEYQKLLDEYQPKINRLQNSFMLTSEALVNLRFEVTEKNSADIWTQASLMMLLNSVGHTRRRIRSLLLEIHTLCSVHQGSTKDLNTSRNKSVRETKPMVQSCHKVEAPDFIVPQASNHLFSNIHGSKSFRECHTLKSSVAWGVRNAARGFDYVIHHPDMPREGTRKYRIWELLERPDSSRKAKLVNHTLFVAILLGTLIFCLETLPCLQVYGEGSLQCEKVVRSYCKNKDNPILDPGCFYFLPQLYNSSTIINKNTAKLRFFCTDDPNCYGLGLNFGSGVPGALSCTSGIHPFRKQDQLDGIGLFDIAPNRKYPVCRRRECDDSHRHFFDGSFVWSVVEGWVNIIFIVEIIARIWISRNLARYLLSWQTWVDVLSTVPFIIELIQAFQYSRMPDHSYSLADSSILLFIRLFKVIRIFKMMQHFPSTGILIRTFKKSYTKLLVPMFLLFMFVIIFGHVVYHFERGQSCYVGKYCSHAPNLDLLSEEYGWAEGKRVLINHKGDPTDFPDFRASIWLTMVTLTSVGFGGISPISVLGRLFAAVMMLFGNFYLAMPLTIVGGIFFSEYKAFKKAQGQSKTKMLTQEKKEIQLDLYHSSLLHEATYCLSYLDSVTKWANVHIEGSVGGNKLMQLLTGAKKIWKMSESNIERIRKVDPVNEMSQAILCYSSLASIIRRISEELMGRKKQELKNKFNNWTVLHKTAKRDMIHNHQLEINTLGSNNSNSRTRQRLKKMRRVSVFARLKTRGSSRLKRKTSSLKNIVSQLSQPDSARSLSIKTSFRQMSSFQRSSSRKMDKSENSKLFCKESTTSLGGSTEKASAEY